MRGRVAPVHISCVSSCFLYIITLVHLHSSCLLTRNKKSQEERNFPKLARGFSNTKLVYDPKKFDTASSVNCCNAQNCGVKRKRSGMGWDCKTLNKSWSRSYPGPKTGAQRGTRGRIRADSEDKLLLQRVHEMGFLCNWCRKVFSPFVRIWQVAVNFFASFDKQTNMHGRCLVFNKWSHCAVSGAACVRCVLNLHTRTKQEARCPSAMDSGADRPRGVF